LQSAGAVAAAALADATDAVPIEQWQSYFERDSAGCASDLSFMDGELDLGWVESGRSLVGHFCSVGGVDRCGDCVLGWCWGRG